MSRGEKAPAVAPKKVVPVESIVERFAPSAPADRPCQASAPFSPPPGVPKVELADKDARTCLVKVGDALPEAELLDLTGTKQRLRDSYGPRLTVVFFWNAEGPYGVEQLQDMAKGLCEPFGGKGLRVVGVNCRDSAAVARANASAAAVAFPILLDADGALLAKAAPAGPPRTYLLDASGRILWFDMEYSAAPGMTCSKRSKRSWRSDANPRGTAPVGR